MRTATLIVAAVSSLSLAAPAEAQQRGWQGARPSTSAPRMPSTTMSAPRISPTRQGGWNPSTPRPGGWKPQPGTPRPGGWQPGRPPQGGWQPGRPPQGGWQPGRPPHGGWKPGTPGRPPHGGWQPGKPGKPGDWKPGRPGGWNPGKPGGWHPGKPGGWKPGTGSHRPGWRWGDKIRGRWHAGWNAPGGWGGYRRPVRGWTLPSYWIGGGFWISDWSNWGLSSPPYGYNWVRYYDDAVLVDNGGRVWDSVSGLDWDRGDEGYAEDGYAYEGDDRGFEGNGYEGEEGYPGPGADYDQPEYRDDDYGYREAPRVHVVPARPLRCVANCYNGAYAQGGYYGGPTTTTVVIQSAPVVTTTVTETVEEVTYSTPRKVVRRVPSKKLYRAPVKSKTCYCR